LTAATQLTWGGSSYGELKQHISLVPPDKCLRPLLVCHIVSTAQALTNSLITYTKFRPGSL